MLQNVDGLNVLATDAETGADEPLCHRRYCSALDSRLIAEDVRFVVVYLHNCKALRYAA